MQPDRQLCEHCEMRLAKKGRRWCDSCYRRGLVETTLRSIRRRPRYLVDTGLRIDDDSGVMFHVDGNIEPRPAPPGLFRFYWIDDDPEWEGLLRLQRPSIKSLIKAERKRT